MNARQPTRRPRAWAARKKIRAPFMSNSRTWRRWAASFSSPEIFIHRWRRCTPSCSRPKTAGDTWTEPHPRIHSSGLDQIQFVDFQNGWISGANLQGAPRDPFLLITTDGGKTWRERPIFEETRVAAIERFWFDSPTNGTMVIDARLDNGKREEYRSHDGGESWDAQQSGSAEQAAKEKPTGRGACAPTPPRTAMSSKSPTIIAGRK